MSRIGKQPVLLPQGVEVILSDTLITVRGSKGELTEKLPKLVAIDKKSDSINVIPDNESKAAKASWGLTRTIINNMVAGVTDGYRRNLEINGVGYRAAIDGNILTLQLGFSHDIKIEVPKDIKVECPKPTELVIVGINKQKVGQFASEIRAHRKPEPYKGKGVRYADEYVRRKEGKKK